MGFCLNLRQAFVWFVLYGNHETALLQMDKERLLLMKGSKGTLDFLGVSEITWTHTPGHSPGHVVFHHKSGLMLGGDFADVLQTAGKPYLKTMCGRTCDLQLAKQSVCQIAHELEFSEILPYHDALKKGYTKSELQPLADAYAGCSKSL